jgi:hypothetical protein
MSELQKKKFLSKRVFFYRLHPSHKNDSGLTSGIRKSLTNGWDPYNNTRSQSFNNPAIMAGKYNGVQANTRVYPEVSGLNHNEIQAYNNKHSLRRNTKGYGGKTH